MDQLLKIWDILLYAINIGVLFLVVKHFVHKPVTKYLEARKQKIADDLDKAANERKLAEDERVKYEHLIENSQEEAARIIAKGRERAELSYNEAVLKGKDEAKDLVARAVREIDTEKRVACENMRTDITDMAIQIASKVLQREVSVEDNKKIIDDFFDEKVG